MAGSQNYNGNSSFVEKTVFKVVHVLKTIRSSFVTIDPMLLYSDNCLPKNDDMNPSNATPFTDDTKPIAVMPTLAPQVSSSELPIEMARDGHSFIGSIPTQVTFLGDGSKDVKSNEGVQKEISIPSSEFPRMGG